MALRSLQLTTRGGDTMHDDEVSAGGVGPPTKHEQHKQRITRRTERRDGQVVRVETIDFNAPAEELAAFVFSAGAEGVTVNGLTPEQHVQHLPATRRERLELARRRWLARQLAPIAARVTIRTQTRAHRATWRSRRTTSSTAEPESTEPPPAAALPVAQPDTDGGRGPFRALLAGVCPREVA